MSVRLLAAALLLPALAAPPASAASANGTGRKCRFESQTSPTAPGTQYGEVDAGPLAFTEGGGTLSCNVYVNGTLAASVSGHTTAVGGVEVAAFSGLVTYSMGVSDVLDACTVMHYDSGPYAGRTQYWRGNIFPPATGEWVDGTPFPGGCVNQAFDLNEPVCPVLLTVDKYAGTDLAVIWQDCEPYGPII